MKPVNVFVAPLDWGLGHASRTIVIVQALKELGCQVIVGGAGDSLELVRTAHPDVVTVALPAYSPVYPEGRHLLLSLVLQMGKFVRAVTKERRLLSGIVSDRHIDLVISDNRYGCYTRKVPSVMVVHQVNLLLTDAFRFMAPLVNRVHRWFLGKFDACWVPDWRGTRSLAPALSATDDPRFQYIGPLSRLCDDGHERSMLFDVSVLISGPEPQRSVFEAMVFRQLRTLKVRACVVRGVQQSPPDDLPEHVTVLGLATAADIQCVMRRSDTIISRSGYSTIMDLVRLGGRVVFVPTPGQTEQEYLARHFEQRGIAGYMEQKQFDLTTAVERAQSYAGFQPQPPDDTLVTTIRAALEKAGVV